MPKLKPIHWIGLLILLVFYGFAVFALTRDYYLRHPARPTAADAPAVTRAPATNGSRPARDTSAIPDSIIEGNPALLHQRADALFMDRRYAEASGLYRRILALDPTDAEAHNDLGLALHYLGDDAGAIEQLRRAVAEAPELQRPWLTLGFISLQAGNVQEAKRSLERARDLDPDSDIGKEAVRLLGLLEQR